MVKKQCFLFPRRSFQRLPSAGRPCNEYTVEPEALQYFAFQRLPSLAGHAIAFFLLMSASWILFQRLPSLAGHAMGITEPAQSCQTGFQRLPSLAGHAISSHAVQKDNRCNLSTPAITGRPCNFLISPHRRRRMYFQRLPSLAGHAIGRRTRLRCSVVCFQRLPSLAGHAIVASLGAFELSITLSTPAITGRPCNVYDKDNRFKLPELSTPAITGRPCNLECLQSSRTRETTFNACHHWQAMQ